MGRALLTATVQDQAGNAVQNALCYVYATGTTTAVSDMFAAASGGSPITTLTSDSRGQIVGWFTTEKIVDIKVTDNTHTAFLASTPSLTLNFSDYTKTVLVEADSGTAFVHTTGAETVAGVKTFTSDPLIPDEVYDATAWNGVLEPPTKNAVRDKIEDILDGVTFTGAVAVPDAAYDATTWNGSANVPTQNAVRDQLETHKTDAATHANLPYATLPLATTQVIYVDPVNGSNSNRGTAPGNAKLTLAAALAAISAGPATVILLPGTLAVPDSIQWKDGVSLSSFGGSVVQAGAALSISSFIQLTNCTNLTIGGGIRFVGQPGVQRTSCFSLNDNCQDVHILPGTMIQGWESDGVVIENSVLGKWSKQCSVQGVSFNDCREGGVIVGCGENIKIAGSIVRSPTNSSLGGTGAIGLGIEPLVDGSTLHHITFENNQTYNCQGQGISCELGGHTGLLVQDIAIVGNQLFDSGAGAGSKAGIRFNMGTGADLASKIASNTIGRSTGPGIEVNAQGVHITANRVQDSSLVAASHGAGISLTDCVDVKVDDNDVWGGNTYYGLEIIRSLGSPDRIVVSNNRLQGTQGPWRTSGTPIGAAVIDGGGNVDRATGLPIGIANTVKAGVPADGDYLVPPPDGTPVLDSSTGDPYMRVAGTWTPSAGRRLAWIDYTTSSDFSTASTTFVDVNADAFTLSIVVPASGKIKHVVDAPMAGVNYHLGLRDGAGNVAGAAVAVSSSSTLFRFNVVITESGLTPGATITRKLAHRVDTGTGHLRTDGDDSPHATWEVFAA